MGVVHQNGTPREVITPESSGEGVVTSEGFHFDVPHPLEVIIFYIAEILNIIIKLIKLI